MTPKEYSAQGLQLTKAFEGLALKAYQDQGGVWTIGYGHTSRNVGPGMTVTQEQAEQLLESDLASAVTAVNSAVKVELTQGEFDALVDFTFNLGAANLLTSTLLRDVNASRFADASLEFPKWNHCKGMPVAGLLYRREAELELFRR